MSFSAKARGLWPALILWALSPSFYGLRQAAAPGYSPVLPPLSPGQRVLLAPQLMLDVIGYWLWPFDREPLVVSLSPEAVMRSGLFYWLLLVIALRFAWRLRRVEPGVFYGLAAALLATLPWSGLWPGLVIPFNPWSTVLAGLPLAATAVLLARRAWTGGRQKPPAGHAWFLTGLALGLWTLALAGNLFVVAGRSWDDRLARLEARHGADGVVAVEVARAWAGQGRLDEAEGLILRCGQALPWYGEIPLVKAEILLARNQPAAARVHLEKVLERVPDHPVARVKMEEI